MAINSVTRIALGLAGATGIGTAVGVPVVLNSQGISAGEDKEGIPKAEVFKSLERCSESNSETGNSVNFGTKTEDWVCGKIETSGTTAISITEDEKYNQLFQNMGNHPKDEGKMYSNFGRADCPDGNKGIIPGQTKEKEFIGLCNGNNSYKQWISIEGKESGNPTVKVCAGDCFEKIMVEDGEKLESNQTKNTGTEIKFQRLTNK